MPKIREYTATESVRADGTAAAATASAAAATQAGYRGFGQSVGGGLTQLGEAIDRHDANEETSKLAAELATLNAELTVEWAERTQTADLNDTELADRFMRERVEPAIAALGETLETEAGRNLYERSAAGMRGHMLVTTTADQTTLGGMAAVHNAETTINQISSAAMADPAGLESQLGLYRTTLTGLSGIDRMNPTQRAALEAKGEEQIVSASFMGAARRNPAAALQDLETGRYSQWFDGTRTAQMRNFAEQVQTDAQQQARADSAENIRANKAAFDQRLNQINAATIDPESGQVRLPRDYFQQVRDAAAMPDADPGSIRAMRSAGIAISKGDPPTSDPNTYLNFLDRMGRGDVSLADINMARGSGLLTNKDYSFLRTWARDLATNPQKREQQRTLNTFFTGMKAHITKSNMLLVDADGNQRYSEYVRDMSSRYWTGLQQGRKPEDMFKEFQGSVPTYQTRLSVSTGRIASGIRNPNAPLPRVTPPAPAAPARLPGESPKAYLDRLRGASAPAAAVAPPAGVDEGLDSDLPEEELDSEDAE